MAGVTLSLVVPVYRNAAGIAALLDAVEALNATLDQRLEAVFVVDGSPDDCYARLQEALPRAGFASQLLAHSRNFGSFAAIRSGLQAATGDYFCVMAADLQEPPELAAQAFAALEADRCDVALARRTHRADPVLSRISSQAFWWCYRKLVVPDMPEGGVDVFGCNRAFRDQLLTLGESRSSLIALLFWLGFRREIIDYQRQPRAHGRSAWTLARKLAYMTDSVFAFTDLPIRLLIRIGMLGTLIAVVGGSAVLAARLLDLIRVPGYAAIMLVLFFFGTLNLLALGLVGTYAWRAYENTKQRPLGIVMSCRQFSPARP